MNAEETYVHTERLAILLGADPIDLDASDLAWDDVERFRSELAAQEKAMILVNQQHQQHKRKV